jgi:hypothetical protein
VRTVHWSLRGSPARSSQSIGMDDAQPGPRRAEYGGAVVAPWLLRR